MARDGVVVVAAVVIATATDAVVVVVAAVVVAAVVVAADAVVVLVLCGNRHPKIKYRRYYSLYPFTNGRWQPCLLEEVE